MINNLQQRVTSLTSNVSIVDPAGESAWDEFVASHPNGWLCLTTEWKRVLEENFPHIKGYFLAMKDERGAIQAGLGLYSVASWLTGRRLVSIPFATLSDPLVSTEDQWRAMTDSAISISKELKSDYLEIRTNNFNGNIPAGRFGLIDLYRHHYIPLDRDLDQIRKSFDRTCVRQRISRAEKSGVTVHPVSTEKELSEFYRLYLKTRKRLQLPPQPYRFIRSLWEQFSPDKVSVRLASYKGENIAGILLFRFRDRVSAEFMVMDERFLSVSPNHLLFWEAIKETWEKKYRIFDFGRTTANNASLLDFKRRWGTEEVDLPIYYHPVEMKDYMQKKEGAIAYKVSKLVTSAIPSGMFRQFGQWFYRHLG